jgi:hypothetical protein
MSNTEEMECTVFGDKVLFIIEHLLQYGTSLREALLL